MMNINKASKNWEARQQAMLKHTAKQEPHLKTRNDKIKVRFDGTEEMQYSIKHNHLKRFTGDVDHASLDDAYDLCA